MICDSCCIRYEVQIQALFVYFACVYPVMPEHLLKRLSLLHRMACAPSTESLACGWLGLLCRLFVPAICVSLHQDCTVLIIEAV